MDFKELQNKLTLLNKMNSKVEQSTAGVADTLDGVSLNEKINVIATSLQAAEHEYVEIINALVRNNVLTNEEAMSGLDE